MLFVPEADGMLVAYDATNGNKLWSHNNGQGHNGGIITYVAKGKQYVAVMTGWGSLVGDGYGDWFGEPWKSMPKDSGVLKVFALQSKAQQVLLATGGRTLPPVFLSTRSAE